MRNRITVALLCSSGTMALLAFGASIEPSEASAPDWRSDPAWYAGKAEWALYDGVRPIYGVDRAYEATIFTNKQHMDPTTTAKAVNANDPGALAVFKHNVSEMIQTENYTYRFLTTSFVEVGSLRPYKIVMSSQEDCGATYKQFIVDDGYVNATRFCYFPAAGKEDDRYAVPESMAFHDALSLTLRDYPFDNPRVVKLELVPDQTDTHETSQLPAAAEVEYVGREILDLPYGKVEAHHLLVRHERDGGAKQSNFWFADEEGMRNVMVKYEGPYGVKYELKYLAWWAYWDRSQPPPRNG